MPITLVQFPPAFGLSSSSPFCTKLEAYFKLAKIDYVLDTGNPRLAPKGKLPYVIDGDTKLADSSLIIEYCKKKYGDPLDARLTPSQRANGHVIRRMLEEHTYWALLYVRWLEPAGWELQKVELAKMLPAPLGMVLPPFIRGSIRKMAHAHGLGRHSEPELYAAASADVEALSTLIGQRDWVLGPEPTSYDATVMAFVWHIIETPSDNPLTRAAKRHDNLALYLERAKKHLGWS